MRCTLQVACLACTAAAYAPQRRRRAVAPLCAQQGDDAWEQLGLQPTTADAARQLGPEFQSPTPAQASAIPSIVEDESDALIHAGRARARRWPTSCPWSSESIALDKPRRLVWSGSNARIRTAGRQSFTKIDERYCDVVARWLLPKKATDVGLGRTPHVVVVESHASPTHGTMKLVSRV